jgi:hypothetical protein
MSPIERAQLEALRSLLAASFPAAVPMLDLILSGAAAKSAKHAEHRQEKATRKRPENASKEAQESSESDQKATGGRGGSESFPGDKSPSSLPGSLPQDLQGGSRRPLMPQQWRPDIGFWAETYASVVRSRMADPGWTFPRKQQGALVDVISARCEDRANIDPWVRETVGDFVDAVRALGEEPRLWSLFGPDGLLRWWNAGRPGMACERAGGPEEWQPTGELAEGLAMLDARKPRNGAPSAPGATRGTAEPAGTPRPSVAPARAGLDDTAAEPGAKHGR